MQSYVYRGTTDNLWVTSMRRRIDNTTAFRRKDKPKLTHNKGSHITSTGRTTEIAEEEEGSREVAHYTHYIPQSLDDLAIDTSFTKP